MLLINLLELELLAKAKTFAITFLMNIAVFSLREILQKHAFRDFRKLRNARLPMARSLMD